MLAECGRDASFILPCALVSFYLAPCALAFFFALRPAPWPFCFFALAGGRGIQARAQRAKKRAPKGPCFMRSA